MQIDVPGVIIGGIVGWLIARHYYKRSAADLTEELRRSAAESERKDTLAYFEIMLERSTWTAETIASKSAWICDQRSLFKIVRNNDFREFDEEWARRVPDQQHNSMCTVDLKINDSTVRPLSFVSLDGGRYLVPLPRKMMIDRKPVYCWERNSLDFKVGRIIGHYYRYTSIEETARFLGVEILP